MRRERAVARRSLDGEKSCEERNATETFVLEGVERKNKAQATAGEEVTPVTREWDARRVGSVRVDGGRMEGDWSWAVSWFGFRGRREWGFQNGQREADRRRGITYT